MSDWKALDKTYIMNTANRLPIVVENAEGNYIYGVDGKKYLDLFSGLGVNILGHRHPAIMKALEEQAHHFLHLSNYFHNPSAISLAKRLVDYTLGSGRVFFTNSGAEATEALVKLVHKWSKKQGNAKQGIIVLTNSFHGRTLGALHLTRQESVYQDYPKPDYPIYEVPPNDIASLEAVCKEHQPAAILVEPILGSGGAIPLSESYCHAIESTCEENGMLFCVDEIQTGIGRTGRLFAYQEFALQPDVVLFAKAIGGGLPLGGLIAGPKVADVFQPGDHGTTFAPSPLAAAMAHAVLDILIGGMLEDAQEVISYLWENLHTLPRQFSRAITRIDGKGMMIGIRTQMPPEKVKRIQMQLLEDGILVDVTARNVIRLLPPLTLTLEEVDLFFHAFKKYVI